MSGLFNAVAKMNAPKTEPIPVKRTMTLMFLQGMKKAANAITGLAMAFKVTAR